MKKTISLFLTVMLVLLTCTACFDQKQTAFEEELTIELNTIYEDLMTKLPDSTDVLAQKDYLIKWAGKHNVPVSYDKHNNIIMSKKAVAGYEDTESTILQCSLGTGDPAVEYEAIATALYLMNKVDNHGFIRALFTVASEQDFSGAKSISTNYLRSDNLINLTGGEKTYLTLGGAGSNNYDFSKQLTWIAPTYPNSYEISIQGLIGGNAGITSGSHPNPIKIIGDFLASAKSKGVLIELASFNGGEAAGSYPTGATAVVLINDSDVTRFEKWFENDSSKFEDKYADIEENYTYTMKPVPSPELVISKDDSTKIFSLMYTMINGIYLKSDEGDITATSNIGTISTTTGNIDVTICARSLQDDTLQEMSSTLEVICGLNDISYASKDNSPIWHEDQQSNLYLRLNDVFKNDFDKNIKQKTTMKTTDCSVFKARNANLDILSMSINFENGVTEVEALKNFLEGLNTPWEPPTSDTQN